ncbi:MAG: hypothetical protein ACR2RE_13165 [Geminicoccaceae bacterium]
MKDKDGKPIQFRIAGQPIEFTFSPPSQDEIASIMCNDSHATCDYEMIVNDDQPAAVFASLWLKLDPVLQLVGVEHADGQYRFKFRWTGSKDASPEQ